jgi:hypothetical protein
MDKLFIAFYEFMLGVSDEFGTEYQEIFPNTGLWTIVIILFVLIIYYLGLTGIYGSTAYRKYYWHLIILIVIISLVLPLLSVYLNSISFDSYASYFLMFNGVAGFFLSILFSILIKNFSLHARKVPF